MTTRVLTVVTAVAVAAWAAGCGALGDDRMPPTSLDDGGRVSVEAGTALDAGDPFPPADADRLLARDDSMTDDSLRSAPGLAECYDADNTCAAATCETVRSCCVGDGACCDELASPPVSALDAAACADATPAEGCFGAAVTPFGMPAPGIVAGAIAAGGDARSDGGLLIGEAVDLSIHRAQLSAVFEPPTLCEGDCVESIAMGVTTQTTITSSVRPMVGLVYSGSLHRMSLVVGDVAVRRWDGVMAPERWTLDLQPSGVVRVEREEAGSEPFEATFVPAPSARIVIWGRSVNPPPDVSPTRISGFTPVISLCDVPSVWRARRQLALLDTAGAPVAGVIESPSVLDDGGERLLAFERDGAIFLATQTAADVFTLTSDTAVVAANAAVDWMSAGVGDPDLVQVDGVVHLWFTARGATSAIGHGALTSTFDALAGAPSRVTVDGWPARTSRAEVPLSEPTLYQHSSGEWVLAARASLDDEAEEIVLLRSGDGVAFTFHEAPKMSELTRRAYQLPLFDADELGDPTLVIHNGAWQLYYAGRRGARWSVGLLLSDDLIEWRRVDPQLPVLRSERDAFDAVTVRAPDILLIPSGLQMVYAADDGVRASLGLTERTATDRGHFP